MTREEMARVVMENYDPAFAANARAGDILVGGWNFGTGSSREQAATALQAKGIALVMAGSFSQTYLRNAYNNGFICIECPELVDSPQRGVPDRGRGRCPHFDPRGSPSRWIFPGERYRFRDETFRFPALGSVPQGLVVAGGSETLIRRKLGLTD